MKLSDQIIAAAIRYQRTCAEYNQAPYDPFNHSLDSNCQTAFNDLKELAEHADLIAEDYKRVSEEAL